VRALDPRLISRTKGTRPLLVLDTILGIGTGVAVLAQASLLAWIVARGFAGAGSARLEPELALLVSAFALRGALAWGMEVVGRRAAWRILSELRMALVAKRLLSGPIAPDGVGGAELAAVAVQGVEGLEGYFARYLPQVVLAGVVPLLVVVWVGVIDPVSGVIMLLTLPLVPVFMWLIGCYTEERTRSRWEALQGLSTHFLDVVRGLPTLRACGRAGAEAERIGAVSERYRATTMETLRISFLSGSVLEFAATLGVALVAVDAGLRMVGGGLALQTGLTVLILAPELYLPFRRLGAEYHASADGLAVAERMFALLDAPAAAAAGGPQLAPSPAHAAIHLEGVSFAYPARATPVLDRLDLVRSGQEHRRGARAVPARADRRSHLRRRCGSGAVRQAGLEATGGLGPSAPGAVPRHGGGEHPARPAGLRSAGGPPGGRARRRRRVHPVATRRL